MPGSNAGTGRPLWFRCSACRLRDGAYFAPGEYRSKEGWIGRVKLTGKKKSMMHKGNAGSRNAKYAYQYKCDCGHTGWSRHVDLENKFASGIDSRAS